ncbi:hypothetical protein LX87_00549 [Larkinella arboricola]|uniref:Uncharacterized protein n=1 Tax=Larkinella arboricola TaxID=643671 RepID=A0A327X6Z1_LARAB|nr:hypothetical protein [Larkinella arboricola]RAK02429.1 hypothetical protein LX87_00549 [Larkinella arboricola]
MVTPLADNCPTFVPGMETYYSAYPVVYYESAKQLFGKLCDSATFCLPKVIVLDLARSTDANLDLLRELKANERLRSIPVLIRKLSTASSTPRTITHAVTTPAVSREESIQPEIIWKPQLLIAS